MEIKEKIKQARQKKNLTQKQLAEKTGLTQTTIAKLETGLTTKPNIEVALKISNVLGVDVNFLFTDSETQFKQLDFKGLKEKVFSAIDLGIDFYIGNINLKYDLEKKEDLEKFSSIVKIANELKNNIQSALMSFGFCTAQEIIDFYNENPEWAQREIARLYDIEKNTSKQIKTNALRNIEDNLKS